MTPEVMKRLFDALPDEIRSSYATGQAGPAALLLLYPSDNEPPSYPFDLEIRGLTALASHLMTAQPVERLILKPHPLNGAEWISRVVGAVRAELPSTSVQVLDRYPAVPIEVAVSGMNIVAAAGIGSTAVQTLSRIYGIPMYSSNDLIRALARHSRTHGDDTAALWEEWIEQNQEFYTSV